MGTGTETRIAAMAALLSNPARAAMLLELSSSEPLAATDLAAAAGVSLPTASSHLAKLQKDGLVAVQRTGRIHRYRIARPQELTRALDALSALGPSDRTSIGSVRETPSEGDDRLARTCYDHLAGRLGVALTDSLIRNRIIYPGHWGRRGARTRTYSVTRHGRDFFRSVGVDLFGMAGLQRALAFACLDRTEGRPHLAGALGAALAARLDQLGWTQAVPGSRTLRVTRAGTSGLRKWFGVEL